MTPVSPSRFRDSAAVVLVRGEGAALEVFWVKRSEAVAFQPGFRAFIGGKVDAADAEVALPGIDDAIERAARVCAVRESLEETGVLVGVAGGDQSAATLAASRARLLAGSVTFATLAAEHDWTLAPEQLTFAGRWQTPVFAPVRFDTFFFMARVPTGQEPTVEPGELESGEWVKPLEALDRYRHGHATFAAPILWTLVALAEGPGQLTERLALGPQRAATPVRRVELKWGVVLHPMETKPLPPARHTNAYLIGEKEMMLVDPGSGDPAALEELFTLIGALEAEGRRVKLIVVTHHHTDHIGGVEACRARYGAKVVGHAALASALRLDLTVKDGDWLPLVPGLGDWNLQVLHTPGHTQDSISLWHPRTRSMFVGDLLPGGAGSVIIDPPDGDMGQYFASLARVAALEPETIFPAHGSPQGAAVRRIAQLVAHRREREAKVFAALEQTPRTLRELVERAYTDTKPELWSYAERSLLAHLLLLERDQRAVRDGERWRSVAP